ncbi:MAG TPA: HAD family phosphatase [Clostridia bacterium]|nr:HAD family phosphatase [Clostridia bacterium]
MNFKLVALDLDGTLLTEDKEVTPETVAAVRRVRERGCEVTLCTGRMFAATLPYARELGITLPLITYNGGLVMTPESREVLYQRSLPNRYAREIIARAREEGLAINYYHEDRLLVEEITEQHRLYAAWSRVPLEPVEDLLALPHDPLKILLMGDEEKLNRLAEEFRRQWDGTVYVTKSWPTFLEFMHPEANKGLGLKALLDHLGLDKSQVLAIGDSYNDLEMFQYAGFAVAMGNGEEAVKKAAHYVTKSNRENGVAQVLEKFITG